MEQSQNENKPRDTYRPKEEKVITYPTDKTALLIIDPVNDFLSEGGAAWELTKNTVEKLHNVIPNIKKAMDGARAKGIKVLFGPMAYTEEDYAEHMLQRRSGINRIMFERKMFLAGSWGADFHPELQPQAEDIVLEPHKSCDVFRTDLPGHLDKMGITHLVIAGMTANLCVESTGRHAMEEGYDVTYLYDAIGASGVPEYEVAVNVNFPMISNAVITVDEFLKAIEPSSESRIDIKEGDTVRGSDHLEVGKVKEFIESKDGNSAYILVPRGLIFKTDTFIPLDAVTKKSGEDVFINLPKIMVDKMPWTEPPTDKQLLEKQGPKAANVDKLYKSQSPTSEG
jgi:nicotinamidase-related amidase